MDEDIIAPIFLDDEAESFGFVEPFHSTCSHHVYLYLFY
jgi:hypothetical protein